MLRRPKAFDATITQLGWGSLTVGTLSGATYGWWTWKREEPMREANARLSRQSNELEFQAVVRRRRMVKEQEREAEDFLREDKLAVAAKLAAGAAASAEAEVEAEVAAAVAAADAAVKTATTTGTVAAAVAGGADGKPDTAAAVATAAAAAAAAAAAVAAAAVAAIPPAIPTGVVDVSGGGSVEEDVREQVNTLVDQLNVYDHAGAVESERSTGTDTSDSRRRKA
jgi:hypothetical protein